MKEYFDKYIRSKIVLSKMIAQFYDSYISLDDAKELNIKYDKDDVKNNYVVCIENNFLPEGNYIWNLLNINNDVITYKNLWNKMEEIREETYDYSKDYRKLYLDNALLVIDMVKKYYKYEISVDEAKRYCLVYDEYLDELEGKVSACHHLFEGAGEAVWYLLGIEKPIVALSEIENMEKDLKKEILNYKVKKLSKN